MKTRTSLPVLLAAGALALAACGTERSGSGLGGGTAAGNGTDRAFVAEMIPHHESAVAMARIAQARSESAFVKRLAGDIVRTQQAEIATLRREDAELAEAGVETGSLGVPDHLMGMDEDTKLRTARPFDGRFLEMMVPHHEGAIEMAKAELADGTDLELKALAQEIADAQQREIDAMGEQLARADG